MKIKTKISLLSTSLILLVVGSIVANLIWFEQRRVRAEFSGRVDALMEGVLRIARESLTTQDELMLLSYVKFLMKDYPEIELAIISREGHTSLIGEVKSPMLYRTITLTERKAAEFKPRAAPVDNSAPDVDRHESLPLLAAPSLPPNTFSIQFGFSKNVLDRKVRAAQEALARKILSIAGAGMLLGILGSLWLGRLLARPVSELALAARQLGEGNLDAAVKASGRDEIADLAGHFNVMAGRIGNSIRFKEDLLSTLTHELNTPLGGVKGFLEYLLGSPKEDPSQRRLAHETMLEAIGQMEISLHNAIALFKSDAQPELHFEPVSVSEIFGEVARLFTPVARSNQIRIEGPVGPDDEVEGDREMMRRICINLVSNALKFTPHGGTVTITIEDKGSDLLASVADTGPGIAPEDQERIFVKFFRLPGPGGAPQRIPGSGLGLAIAKRAVELHGGRIWVQSAPGQGSAFNVLIPKHRVKGDA